MHIGRGGRGISKNSTFAQTPDPTLKILVHKQANITKIVSSDAEEVVCTSHTCPGVLWELAKRFPDEIIGWCEESVGGQLVLENWKEIFHHDLIMASYAFGSTFLPPGIGYVEESPFIKINREVSYPTWQMSSNIGGMHASALLQVGKQVPLSDDFDYYLNSLAKLGQLEGLFCYSEPALLDSKSSRIASAPASLYKLFRFVRQHYKTRWLFLLLVNFVIYEKKFPMLPFLYALWFRSRNSIKISLSDINVCSLRMVVEKGSIDVIIPTIGRKAYLYNVLKDLENQTYLPTKVIVVEQNPEPESESELDYLYNEDWPFVIKHIFTHRAGVCNARNLALEQVESEWVFFNDDDNQLGKELIEEVFDNIERYGATSCITGLNVNNSLKFPIPGQTTTFGSGYSFVKGTFLKHINFPEEMEFGYGEDKEFGMQLRNTGVDIIYFPSPVIQHLNAPSGGFRKFSDFPWDQQPLKPKPSPTLMWYKKRHLTPQQLLGYKTVLFLMELKKGNPREIFRFNKRWRASLNWAAKL